MTIENIISEGIAKALNALYGIEDPKPAPAVSATKKEFEGDLTFVVFPYLRATKKSPEATAEEIGAWLVENVEAVEKFNVVKGFLNITVNPAFWLTLLHEIATVEDFGNRKATPSLSS